MKSHKRRQHKRISINGVMHTVGEHDVLGSSAFRTFTGTKQPVKAPVRIPFPVDTQNPHSYTTPNAKCPVCGSRVYFYQSPDGGRVFFDDLGPPWPKHPCTDNPSVKVSMSAVGGVRDSAWQRSGWRPARFFTIKRVPNRKDVYVIRIERPDLKDWEGHTLYFLDTRDWAAITPRLGHYKRATEDDSYLVSVWSRATGEVEILARESMPESAS